MEYQSKSNFVLPEWGHMLIKEGMIFMDIVSVKEKKLSVVYPIGLQDISVIGDLIFTYDKSYTPIDYFFPQVFANSFSHNSASYWNKEQFFKDLLKNDSDGL